MVPTIELMNSKTTVECWIFELKTSLGEMVISELKKNIEKKLGLHFCRHSRSDKFLFLILFAKITHS